MWAHQGGSPHLDGLSEEFEGIPLGVLGAPGREGQPGHIMKNSLTASFPLKISEIYVIVVYN